MSNWCAEAPHMCLFSEGFLPCVLQYAVQADFDLAKNELPASVDRFSVCCKNVSRYNMFSLFWLHVQVPDI